MLTVAPQAGGRMGQEPRALLGLIKGFLSTYSTQCTTRQGALRSLTNFSPQISIIGRTHYSISQNEPIIEFAFKESEGKKKLKTQYCIILKIVLF